MCISDQLSSTNRQMHCHLIQISPVKFSEDVLPTSCPSTMNASSSFNPERIGIPKLKDLMKVGFLNMTLTPGSPWLDFDCQKFPFFSIFEEMLVSE